LVVGRQCDELLQNSVAPSDVYGAEHLLRLFIKLPELLPYKSLEEATVRGLEKRIAEVTTCVPETKNL
jgi:mortality factor 4-like protein 1